MMNRRFTVAALTTLVMAAALVPSGSALAGTTSDVPDVSVKLRSVTLDGYSGNIEVRTRVRCTQVEPGVGTASWRTSATQDLKASGSAEIACDGVGRRAKIVLDPRNGRFYPGEVGMTIDFFAVGSTGAIGTGSSFTTVV
ncbi:MAG: hypothetical protein LH645_02195 [Actinomycetia bacterium]|nr:hypothetical protein [Actinomycetes bacterium]